MNVIEGEIIDPTGQRCRATYVVINGKKEGKCIMYNSYGELCGTGYYVSDMKHGEYKLFYPHGRLYLNCYYVSDKLEGEIKVYYKTGELMVSDNCVSDKSIGPYIEFYKSGQIMLIRNFSDELEGEKIYTRDGKYVDPCDKIKVHMIRKFMHYENHD